MRVGVCSSSNTVLLVVVEEKKHLVFILIIILENINSNVIFDENIPIYIFDSYLYI